MGKKADYWVPFDGQSLKPGDYVLHRLHGICLVDIATPHTLRLTTKPGKIRINAEKSNIVQYWDVPLTGDRC